MGGRENTSTDIVGGCYCGCVSFSITLPVNRILNCHCNMCRQLSGSAFTTWVSVNKDCFNYTKGEENICSFDVTVNVTQYFCRQCGTRVATTDSRYPSILGLLRGIVEGDLQQPIDGHYFVSHKAAWQDLCDDLPQYGGESGFERLR